MPPTGRKASSAAEQPETEAAQMERREGEAEEAREQAEAEETAEQRRERDEQRRMEAKSYPDDAEAPPTQVKKGGETAYALDRLINESYDFLGVESHVAAGALHGIPDAYLTVADAKKRVEAWLQTEVS